MKTILITGSTDGIGKETALQLARHGHKIIMHGRSDERCQKAMEFIEKESGNNNISYLSADFASLKKVKILADQIKEKYEKIDVLLNNAGVYMNEKTLSEDCYEMTFAVNHLAPYLLTNELLDIVKKSEEGRIVNVSSIAHMRGNIDFENLNAEKEFDSYSAYSLSKLCNVLFTYKLSDELSDSNVTVNCLHPGVIDTKLLRSGFAIMGDSLAKGAETSVFLAHSDKVKGITGKYYDNKQATPSSEISYNQNYQDRLWVISKSLINRALS